MKLPYSIAIASILFALAGCATTNEVTLVKVTPTKQIKSVSLVIGDGNSPEMTGYLQGALAQEGLAVKTPLPKGTKTSKEVDAIVSYVDMWRWDMKMYLQSVSVQLVDAESGDVLVIGEANNAPYFHSFPDPQVVIKSLVAEMLTKLRSATK